ncbi:MAG: hypothetical protein M1839_003611 [Geoglossum umbratile]|nr:MAG: hypothetical protein M1839_003611 [Geoglossum umbratile]
MPSRPDPPADCQEASSYNMGDEVYYFRMAKWRKGTCEGKAGSSDTSTRYNIKDVSNGDYYIIPDCDMRKRT